MVSDRRDNWFEADETFLVNIFNLVTSDRGREYWGLPSHGKGS